MRFSKIPTFRTCFVFNLTNPNYNCLFVCDSNVCHDDVSDKDVQNEIRRRPGVPLNDEVGV